MTTDNKTLAHAQPGGRVRLGDQAERARFEEWYVQNAFDYEANPIGSRDCALMRKAWNAALSAQPSPDGQGGLNYERMFVDACAALAEVSRELGCDPEQGGAEPILAAIAELREALAARQPVGEPVGQVRETVGRGFIAELLPGVSDRVSNMAPLYLQPPAQAVNHQAALLAEERAHGETIDQRDRYHEVADELAARIAAITGVDIGEHSSANCPWRNAIEAVEEYKPAQAVDLGRFRKLASWVANCAGHGINDAQRRMGEELLALIDSNSAGGQP